MTKTVRNSARLTITAFGGAVGAPMAERSSDRTTTIRVNEVTMTSAAGASESSVIRATSCSARSVTPAPWPRSSVRVCAAAVPDASHGGDAARCGEREAAAEIVE